MLLLVLAGFRVDYDVLNPTPGFGGRQQVVAIEVARGVHPQAGVPSPQVRIVVANGNPGVAIDDEGVPLAVHAFRGVVVGNRVLQAQGIGRD